MGRLVRMIEAIVVDQWMRIVGGYSSGSMGEDGREAIGVDRLVRMIGGYSS